LKKFVIFSFSGKYGHLRAYGRSRAQSYTTTPTIDTPVKLCARLRALTMFKNDFLGQSGQSLGSCSALTIVHPKKERGLYFADEFLWR